MPLSRNMLVQEVELDGTLAQSGEFIKGKRSLLQTQH